ncbi:hypothetical protein EV693_11431 [Nicoletella semolina]|uniref:Lipoprotein n=1 Tax=Nicoletella semolina TaxID=271160 RepID=A0A4R2N5H8_9PAST|nr:hypothetical protein [Nicoletella semolina]MDH2925435.1 hypothetical protein [Nicoletella semolina]TCP16114.1 hypothetical protein EV693_11431 [Nicoletella semolina]
MKLIKFLPTFAAAVLAACSSDQSVLEQAAQATKTAANQVTQVADMVTGQGAVQVEKLTNRSKSVVYSCQNHKTVTASYAFQDDQVKAVNLVVGKGKKAVTIPALTRDEANQDFTSFTSNEYVWNVENGFTFDNATSKVGGMLTKKGKDSDEILAKLCDINTSATKKLNK